MLWWKTLWVNHCTSLHQDQFTVALLSCVMYFYFQVYFLTCGLRFCCNHLWVNGFPAATEPSTPCVFVESSWGSEWIMDSLLLSLIWLGCRHVSYSLTWVIFLPAIAVVVQYFWDIVLLSFTTSYSSLLTEHTAAHMFCFCFVLYLFSLEGLTNPTFHYFWFLLYFRCDLFAISTSLLSSR